MQTEHRTHRNTLTHAHFCSKSTYVAHIFVSTYATKNHFVHNDESNMPRSSNAVVAAVDVVSDNDDNACCFRGEKCSG